MPGDIILKPIVTEPKIKLPPPKVVVYPQGISQKTALPPQKAVGNWHSQRVPQAPLSPGPVSYIHFIQNSTKRVSLPLSNQEASLKDDNMFSSEAKQKAMIEQAEKMFAQVKIAIGDFAQKMTPFLHNFGTALPSLFTNGAVALSSAALADSFGTTSHAGMTALNVNMTSENSNEANNTERTKDIINKLKKKYPKLKAEKLATILKPAIVDYQIEYIDTILEKNPSFNSQLLYEFIEKFSEADIIKESLTLFQTRIDEKVVTNTKKGTTTTPKFAAKDLVKLLIEVSQEKDLGNKQLEWLNQQLDNGISNEKLKLMTLILQNFSKPELYDIQANWAIKKFEENPANINIINTILNSINTEECIFNESDLNLIFNWLNEQINNPKESDYYKVVAMTESLIIINNENPATIKKAMLDKHQKALGNKKEKLRTVLSNLKPVNVEKQLAFVDKILSINDFITPEIVDDIMSKVNPEIIDDYSIFLDKFLQICKINAKYGWEEMFRGFIIPPNMNFQESYLKGPEFVDNSIKYFCKICQGLKPEISKKQLKCFEDYSKIFTFEDDAEIGNVLLTCFYMNVDTADEQIEWINDLIKNKKRIEVNQNMETALQLCKPTIVKKQLDWIYKHRNQLSLEQTMIICENLNPDIADFQLALAEMMLEMPKNEKTNYMMRIFSSILKPDIYIEQINWINQNLKKFSSLELLGAISKQFKKEIVGKQIEWIEEITQDEKRDFPDEAIPVVLGCIKENLADEQFAMATKILKYDPNINLLELKKYIVNEIGLQEAKSKYGEAEIKQIPKVATDKKGPNTGEELIDLLGNVNKVPEKDLNTLNPKELINELIALYTNNDEIFDNERLIDLHQLFVKTFDLGIFNKVKNECIQLIQTLQKQIKDKKIVYSDDIEKIEKKLKNLIEYKLSETVYDNYRNGNVKKNTNIPDSILNFIINELPRTFTEQSLVQIQKEDIIPILIKLEQYYSSKNLSLTNILSVNNCIERKIIDFITGKIKANANLQPGIFIPQNILNIIDNLNIEDTIKQKYKDIINSYFKEQQEALDELEKSEDEYHAKEAEKNNNLAKNTGKSNKEKRDKINKEFSEYSARKKKEILEKMVASSHQLSKFLEMTNLSITNPDEARIIKVFLDNYYMSSDSYFRLDYEQTGAIIYVHIPSWIKNEIKAAYKDSIDMQISRISDFEKASQKMANKKKGNGVKVYTGSKDYTHEIKIFGDTKEDRILCNLQDNIMESKKYEKDK